jgi:hypothetical protein
MYKKWQEVKQLWSEGHVIIGILLEHVVLELELV